MTVKCQASRAYHRARQMDFVDFGDWDKATEHARNAHKECTRILNSGEKWEDHPELHYQSLGVDVD